MIHMEPHDRMGHHSRQITALCDPKWDNPCPDFQDSSAQNQVQMCHVHGGSLVGAGQHQHPALGLKGSVAATSKVD